MTSREATIYQLKKLRGQPLNKKITYILSNFWIPIVAILAAIVFVISMIVHWATLKPTALTLCCVNSVAEYTAVEDYMQGFAEIQGIDVEEYQLTADMLFLGQGTEEDYQSSQIFQAKLIAGNLDVVAADNDVIMSYAYQEAFVDLRELLTQEQMEVFAPYFLYMDRSRVQEMNTLSEEPRQIPDPTKPEEMAEPIPVAIALQPDWDFTQACYPYTYSGAAVGMISNSNNEANAKAFFKYILEQEEN